jgi:5-methylcytosine-specific restriction endonuclease McrA
MESKSETRGLKRQREKLRKELQVSIFRRDGWLCRWCKRPVIFNPVMKYLEIEVRRAGHAEPLAYYHKNWTRGGAPLLDELGAVVDHVEAFASGGQCNEQNLVTACCKCNGRKSSARLDEWNQREKRKPIKGKYGEPQHWDGLSTVFIVLAESSPSHLTKDEKEWLRALKNNRQ